MKRGAIDNYARKTGVNQDCCGKSGQKSQSPWRESLREEMAFHLRIENG